MGFYDAKGYWRSDGDGFYDSKGNWVSPGGAFYDGRGYLRSPGDGFYDSKGNWVSPGGAFYDGRGVLQSSSSVVGVAGVVGVTGNDGSANGAVVAVLFLLAVPIFILWALTAFLIQWMASHLYLVFIGYLLLAAVICFVITKRKKHRGVCSILSYAGSYLCLLSSAYITLVYAIPYVILHEESFGSLFEFTVALAVGAAAVAILQFFNYYHENAVLELILSILFFIAVLILLRFSTNGIDSLQDLAAIYGVKPSGVFKLLFGVAI